MSEPRPDATGDRSIREAVSLPTRDEFMKHVAAARRVESSYGRVLALFSVVGGVVQLMFLRWAESHLARGPRLGIAFPAFLLYLGVVVVLLLRMQRRVRAALPACPRCGTRLRGMSMRVAAATGKCDNCGGEVFRPRP